MLLQFRDLLKHESSKFHQSEFRWKKDPYINLFKIERKSYKQLANKLSKKGGFIRLLNKLSD